MVIIATSLTNSREATHIHGILQVCHMAGWHARAGMHARSDNASINVSVPVALAFRGTLTREACTDATRKAGEGGKERGKAML